MNIEKAREIAKIEFKNRGKTYFFKWDEAFGGIREVKSITFDEDETDLGARSEMIPNIDFHIFRRNFCNLTQKQAKKLYEEMEMTNTFE